MNTAMRALLFCGILALLATACTPRLSVSTEVRLRDASRASLRSSIDSTNTLGCRSRPACLITRET